MHTFPFYYTGEVITYKQNIPNKNSFNYGEYLWYDDKNKEYTVLSLSSPLSKLPIRALITIDEDGTTITYRYKISMFENNIILLSSIVFSSFLTYNNDNVWASISIIVGISLYIYNSLKLSSAIKDLLNISDKYIDSGEPTLWKEQQKWLNSPDACPACGEPANPYSKECINCGLLFNTNAKQKHNNKTATYNFKIRYSYNKKP